MVFKLKCRVCGASINFDTERKSETFQQCPDCGIDLDMPTEQRLKNVTMLEKFELIGIEQKFSSKVLANDLSGLERIFDRSDDIRQKRILNIIDKLYLMLERKDTNLEEVIEEYLRKLFFDTQDKGTYL